MNNYKLYIHTGGVDWRVVYNTHKNEYQYTDLNPKIWTERSSDLGEWPYDTPSIKYLMEYYE